jgi:hypothetical protein
MKRKLELLETSASIATVLPPVVNKNLDTSEKSLLSMPQ